MLAFSSHSVVHATLPPQLYIDVPSLARAYYTCILKLIGTFYLSKDIVITKLIIIKFIIWTIKVLMHVRLSKFHQYIYIYNIHKSDVSHFLALTGEAYWPVESVEDEVEGGEEEEHPLVDDPSVLLGVLFSFRLVVFFHMEPGEVATACKH